MKPSFAANLSDRVARLRAIRPRAWRLYLIMAGVFALALILSFGAASLAARGVEHVVARDAQAALDEHGIDWPELRTDGLLLHVSGEAETEAARFRALNAVSTVVSAERVIDDLTVAPSREIAAPRFSLEILRNGLDVSIIGLIPAAVDADDIIARIEGIDPELSVVNMLETADHAVPMGWTTAVDYGLGALARIEASKVSISAEHIEITGLANSVRERDEVRDHLIRNRPRGLISTVEISAPRPVITPFTLRFVKDEEGARFDACAADTQDARAAILAAARRAGATGMMECTLGLGSPTPRWQQAATEAIGALAQLDTGNVTISDIEVSLVAPHAVPGSLFDRVVGELENRLPEVFSLTALRLPPEVDEDGRPDEAIEFIAARSTDGAVTLSGRLNDERVRDAVAALARAQFGGPSVMMSARLDADLPGGWPRRALLAVDALGYLEHGQVRMRQDRIDIRGVSGDAEASDKISRNLGEQLGGAAVFNLNISYDERFDPIAMIPTPARCERWIGEILDEQQITFDPGSVDINPDASRVVDRIANVLRDCGRLEMEVGGHTDSQGSLEGNMRLSQRRAESVLAALMQRGALVSEFEARGFGPEFPIADNSTAAGREANRRIEIRLIGASAEAAEEERASGTAPEPDDQPIDEADLEIAVSAATEDTPRAPERPSR